MHFEWCRRQLVQTSWRLQAVQSAAACLVISVWRSDVCDANDEAALLATGQAASGFQTGCVGVQSTARNYTTLCGRGLPTRRHYWPPSSAIVGSQHMLDHPDKLMSWAIVPLLPLVQSKTLEQSVSSFATAGSKLWAISTGTQDTSVCSCMTAVPSDYCFLLVLPINILTYLPMQLILTKT